MSITPSPETPRIPPVLIPPPVETPVFEVRTRPEAPAEPSMPA